MTKVEALRVALNTMTDNDARATIEKMIETLSKSRTLTDEQKSARNAARKEKTAIARKALMDIVLPLIKQAMPQDAENAITAKELYEKVKNELPADFTANKVQYVLLHEMAQNVNKIETKGKANTYFLKD